MRSDNRQKLSAKGHRPPSTRRIINDTWPIFLGMSAAMFAGWVDTVVASRLSVAAIAAAGICSFVYFFLFSFANGFATAFQRAVAVEKAASPGGRGGRTMTTALLLAVCTSMTLALGLGAMITPLFQILAPDAEIRQLCIDYMQVLLLGLPFYYCNSLMRGYLSAQGQQRVYMRNNVAIQLANIFLSLGLGLGMFGLPTLGMRGIGLATSYAYIIGTMLYLPTLVKAYRRTSDANRSGNFASARQLVKTAFVAGARLNLYALGWVVSFWIVGLGGQNDVATYQIVANLTLPAIYLANSFGVTAINFSSAANLQVHGSDAIGDGLKVVRVSAITTFLYAVVAAALVPVIVDWLTSGTLTRPDYLIYIIMSVLILFIYTAGVVLVNTIEGLGRFFLAFVITVSGQWLVFLPLAWVGVTKVGVGLYGVFSAELAYRVVVCVLAFSVLYRLRRDTTDRTEQRGNKR